MQVYTFPSLGTRQTCRNVSPPVQATLTLNSPHLSNLQHLVSSDNPARHQHFQSRSDNGSGIQYTHVTQHFRVGEHLLKHIKVFSLAYGTTSFPTKQSISLHLHSGKYVLSQLHLYLQNIKKVAILICRLNGGGNSGGEDPS